MTRSKPLKRWLRLMSCRLSRLQWQNRRSGWKSIPDQEQAGEPIPELPDWLAEAEALSPEELDWTPPPVPTHPLDINQASLAELERLPGIGFIAAQQIVSYREEHGAFENPEGLLLVPEITRETLDGIRSLICTQLPSQPALSEQIEQEFTSLKSRADQQS